LSLAAQVGHSTAAVAVRRSASGDQSSQEHRVAGSWYKDFSTEAEARGFADRELPIAKKVVVRFNPKNSEPNNLELDS
jgi:hypothetical protein